MNNVIYFLRDKSDFSSAIESRGAYACLCFFSPLFALLPFLSSDLASVLSFVLFSIFLFVSSFFLSVAFFFVACSFSIVANCFNLVIFFFCRHLRQHHFEYYLARCRRHLHLHLCLRRGFSSGYHRWFQRVGRFQR